LDYEKVIKTIKRDGREFVNLVVLGRGANEDKVDKWLEIGAKEEWFEVGSSVEGVIGFAVVELFFGSHWRSFYKGEIGKSAVIQKVSENFQKFYRVFSQLKNF